MLKAAHVSVEVSKRNDTAPREKKLPDTLFIVAYLDHHLTS